MCCVTHKDLCCVTLLADDTHVVSFIAMFCHKSYFLRYRDLDGGGPQVNEHHSMTHHEVIPSEPSDIGQATLVTTSPGMVTSIISFFLLFHIWRVRWSDFTNFFEEMKR